MALLTRKSLILAKIESTYGSDPTPTTSADAIVAYDVEIKPTIEPLERPDMGISLSRQKELGGIRKCEVTFMTEIRGSGTAGTPPQGIDALLKACGMSVTNVPATSDTYKFLSATFPSVTIYVYKDGLQHQVQGCVGNWELVLEAGQTPKINWTFMGLYETPTDVTFPTSYTVPSTVPVVGKGYTITYDSVSIVARSLKLSSNNEIVERPDLAAATGIAGFQIVDRNPEGTLLIEAVLLATKNWLTDFEADTVNVLSCVIGATAGNIFTITASQCRLRNMNYQDLDGIVGHEFPIQLARSSANDEITLVHT